MPIRRAYTYLTRKSRASLRSFTMSPSGAEVLRQIKDRIDEVDPSAVREQLQDGALVIDVRQDEEWAIGHIPGAHLVPKSHLESRVEGSAPDKAQPVILYC